MADKSPMLASGDSEQLQWRYLLAFKQRQHSLRRSAAVNLRAESTGFTSRASVRYQFAIYQFIRNENAYDPVFKKQVATAYAKFLKKQNQPEQAKAIVEEFCKR
ncbi:hypothetical protein BH10CYA1_BH10CYA1_41060 [soil metagenome]